MRRREFIAGLGAAAWPFALQAQPSEMRRVGVLMNVLHDDPGGITDVAAFRKGLMDFGWVEGRNIQIELRWPGGDVERAQVLARELVGLKPDVLLARSTPTTAALKRESSMIPIVFVNVAEPIESGFVQTLGRPGGHVTGFTSDDRRQVAAAAEGGRSPYCARRHHLQSADSPVCRIVSTFRTASRCE